MKQKQTMAVWNVKANKFPKKSRWNTKLKFLLNYAILSPSGYNAQPWKFSINDNEINVWADLDKARMESDKKHREMFISLGSAIANMVVAADYFGLSYDVDYLPLGEDKDLAARISFEENGEAGKNMTLFEAITKRRTNRGEFSKKMVEKNKRKAIKNVAKIKGVESRWVNRPSQRKKLAEIILTSNKIWYDNKALVEELRSWWGWGLKKNTFKALKEKDRAIHTPVTVVIVSEHETRLAWIKTGIQLELMLLKATSLGVDQGYFNTVIQLPSQRQKLKRFLRTDGYPQLLVRLGYAVNQATHSPRQTVKQVLISRG